nr:SsgA family sporulation/cell division regulator [Glycomyces sp. NRRL B-16210]
MARSATVDIGTTMRLVAPDFATVSVRASLRYDPDDPYAVCVMFHPDGTDADQVAWSFSRELLAKGLEEPTGIGDVRVWPWTTPRGESVALALSSPDGNALFEINRGVVQRFLRRAYSLVPRGRESGYVDMDTTLVKLLAGGVLAPPTAMPASRRADRETRSALRMRPFARPKTTVPSAMPTIGTASTIRMSANDHRGPFVVPRCQGCYRGSCMCPFCTT